MMAGVYSVSNITLNGSLLPFSNLTPVLWTVTGFPTSPGFVRVDPANRRRHHQQWLAGTFRSDRMSPGVTAIVPAQITG